jgi:autotransporter-associated beta strand protein
MKTFTPKSVVAIAAALLFAAAQQQIVASSATWSANPTSGDWNTAENWMPATIPNGTSDIATFGQSAVTNLSINTTSVSVDSIVYEAGASPYTITTTGANLSLYGSGIVNNSGTEQSFNMGENLIMFFYDFATAGEMTSLGGPGGQFVFYDSSSAGSASFDIISTTIQAQLIFEDSSTASDATITDINAEVAFFGNSTAANTAVLVDAGGFVSFGDNATADRTIITVNSDGNQYFGSGIDFQQFATAANGSFTASGATTSAGFASNITFTEESTAANAQFVLNGGSANGAAGTVMTFYDTSTAANATITANGGTNGGKGASVNMNDSSLGGTAHFAVYGNGDLDIHRQDLGGVTIGSLEGNGRVLLGADQLGVGSANNSTIFSGSIQDGSIGGGSLSKLGTGTLTLSGANTYTGGTYISAGALVASNTSGSATGAGNVAVNGGTLGGGGTIAGAVTVGTGSNSGAILQPGFGINKKVTLTIQGLLTFNADATYSFGLKSKKAEVVANGVTIVSGTQFTMTAPNRRLPAHKTATVISNTSASPISGTFANLPAGGTITIGVNTFQANYEGGDGNDLTLTVLP